AAANGIAIDGSGDVIVTGQFSSGADFGGGVLTSVGGGQDAYIAKYSPSGSYLWSRSFGGTGWDNGIAVAVDTSSNVIVAGQFANAVDFGGGPLTSAGSSDIFLAKYSATGVYVWSKSAGGAADDYVTAIAVDTSNNIVVTGYFPGTINFGGGTLTS